MFRSILLSLCLSFTALPAFASVHYWVGAASNRLSDPANWSGGSPIGDSDATLAFDSRAARFDVYNDVPNYPFKQLQFRYQNYTLFGETLVVQDGSIAGYDTSIYCDITVNGTLTISGSIGFHFVIVGAIGGPGGVTFDNASVALGGTKSNTYQGETLVKDSVLTLSKSGGAIAIPGNLRAERTYTLTRVQTTAPGQFAVTAAVIAAKNCDLVIGGDETVHDLQLAYIVYDDTTPQGAPRPTITTDSLELIGHDVTNQVDMRTNLHLTGNVLEVPKDTTLTVDGKVTIPSSGLTVRGEGGVRWSGDYAAPLRLDATGTSVLNTPQSPVQMTGGVLLGGVVASLNASGGTVTNSLASRGDLRLGPGVTLSARLSSYNTAPLEVNGVLDLGGATLALLPGIGAVPTAVIVRNASSQPVIGTFKDIPEGSITQNRWRVSYRGGDGNDVTVTDLNKPEAGVSITQDPKPAFAGEPVTITASVAGSGPAVPTGTVTFRTGYGMSLGTATITDGKASVQWTPATPDDSSVYYRYSGDAVYGSNAEQGAPVSITWHTPVITSIDPTSVAAGSKVTIAVHGSNFMPGSYVTPTNVPITTSFVSSTELRATLDLTFIKTATTLQVQVFAPSGSISSDPKPLAVTAPPPSTSPIQFDGAMVLGTVTPHAKTAWITSDSFISSAFVSDDDGDGIVRWNGPAGTGVVYAMAEIANGNFAVRGNGNSTPTITPLPARLFLSDASGNLAQIVLNIGDFGVTSWNFLWVRPGVGAWRMGVDDGKDADGASNGMLVTSLSAMTALGDSPPHPAGVRAGDVIIVMPIGRNYPSPLVYAAKLDAGVAGTEPGIIQTFGSFPSFAENAGLAHVQLLRTNDTSGVATVHYRTIDRHGLGSERYVPASGVVTFAPGELLKTIDIPLIDDTIYDGNDLFDLVLSDPSGAILGEQSDAVVTITDDDERPLADVAGPTRITVTHLPAVVNVPLTLAGATNLPIYVHWQLSVGLQSGAVVFVPGEHAKNLSLTIPEGTFSQQILLDFLGDTKTRFVTIVVDVPPKLPVINVSDVVVPENAGTAHLTVSMPSAPGQSLAINWKTADGTARSGSDYVAKSGTVFLTPTQTQQTIDVPINDDGETEGDESFVIQFSSTQQVTFSRSSVSVVIADDETPSRPQLSVADHASIAESGAALSLEVHLSQPSTRTVKVHYTTSGMTATPALDFADATDVLTFAPGETSKTITIPVFSDTVVEPDETFAINLSGPENATLGNATTVVTILSADAVNKHRRSTGH